MIDRNVITQPKLQMNNELLTQIIHLSQELAQAKDIDQLLSLAVSQTMEIVGAERCYLILVNKDGGLEFRVRSTRPGIMDEGEDDKSISRSIFNKVVKSGKPLVLTDALSDDQFATTSVLDLNIRSIMCVPLISRGQTLGALYVENRTISGAFLEEDLEPLALFANQAAVTIENALIIANLEERVDLRTAEVQHSWQEAMEANRLRTIFLSQLAHDLRSPATVIRLSLELLGIGELSEAQQKRVARASLSIDQVLNLIEDVFELSKNELRASELNKQAVALYAFLSKMFDIGRGLPRPEPVEFRQQIPKSLPVVNIDPVRIQQVIINLISNAFKFTERGEVVLYAFVDDDEQFVHIGVRDTGIGIPEEEAPKIFKRFYQSENLTQNPLQGAGLGLAISYELVERHNGRLWLVSSDASQGSNFCFTLPLENGRK